MNGLLNLFYPVLDAYDWALGFLPTLVRVIVLGVLSGAVAMGLYVLLSDQAKIRARKAEMQRIRAALAAAKDDFNETMRLSKRNLAASFGLLGESSAPPSSPPCRCSSSSAGSPPTTAMSCRRPARPSRSPSSPPARR